MSSTCGKDITFRCTKPGCTASKSRRGTRRELKILDVGWLSKPMPVHRVWHDFQARFLGEDGETWNMIGYDLMRAVRRWAKPYKNDVKVVGCDDDFHASSSLVLIEHKAEDQYMGTTVVFIPQCTGEKPTRFFLYPRHRTELIMSLMAMDAYSRGPMEMQHIKDTERAVAVSKIRP